MTTLPSPRDVLTSLLSTISSIPSPPTNETNPLRSIPPSHQPLLATLHVLFPSLLLPALDLLDRGLVAHILLDTSKSEQEKAPTQSAPHTATFQNARDDAPVPEGREGAESAEAWGLYIVTSVGSTMRRRQRERESEGVARRYVVNVEGWNCSCPSFAFDAFPPKSVVVEQSMTVASGRQRSGEAMVLGGGEQGLEEPDEAWSFGGLSLDGRGEDGFGPGVPCCKHLLACILAERWPALRGHVVKKKSSKAEMAGLVAEA